METFKYKKGFYKTPSNKFIDSQTTQLRGHSQKLFKQRAQLDVHKNFLSRRVVEPWNSLDEATVSVDKPRVFRNKLKSCVSSDEGTKLPK